jgi:4'-phosphopantetheinyl transferase EntD
VILFKTRPGIAAFLEEGALAGEWSSALGLQVEAAAACAPLSVDLLAPWELARYRALDVSLRRPWLTGRAALRRLRARLGMDPEAAVPAGGFSVSHSAGLSIAIAAASGPSAGVGVDLEPHRPLHPDTAFVILSAAERANLDDPGAEAADGGLLRLWTAKAALFKADPDREGRAFTDYRVADAGLRRGKAALRPGLPARRFRYVSHRLGEWHLSLATAAF